MRGHQKPCRPFYYTKKQQQMQRSKQSIYNNNNGEADSGGGGSNPAWLTFSWGLCCFCSAVLLLMAGVINIPAVALGMFSGGLCMKKLKMSLMGAARFALGTSLIGYVLSLLFFAMSCENAKVAGVTLPYTDG